MVRLPLANSNKFDILLTNDQFNAIEDRDMIRARQLGVPFDAYMSCIDPEYPLIVNKR